MQFFKGLIKLRGVNVDNVAEANVSPLGELLLGSGPEPRPVRPVPPTPAFPNPPLVFSGAFHCDSVSGMS